MFKYFKELLETLKKIEEHLSLISRCVMDAPQGRSYEKCINIKRWNI